MLGSRGGPMRTHRGLALFLLLLFPAAFAISAVAQQAEPPAAPAQAPATPAPAKHPAKPKPPAATKPPAAMAGGLKPTLLAQYGDWGAYTATPGGKKICFAIAKPSSSETKPANRPRNEPYMFISTRPADKVINEGSIAVG